MISTSKSSMISYDFTDISGTIIQKIRELSKKENITKDMIFWEDIFLDSLDVGELMMFIQNNFGNDKNISVKEIKTVGDLLKIVAKK